MIKFEIIKSDSWPKDIQRGNRYYYWIVKWLMSEDDTLIFQTESDAEGKCAYRCVHSYLSERGMLDMVIGSRSHKVATFRKLPNFDVYYDDLVD